jgi:preprotein translocase subunit SecA
VEARNFDIRKQLLEYDDVSNDQRKVIYQQRNELLEATDVAETITAMRQSVVTEVTRTHVPAGSIEEQWSAPELEEVLRNEWSLDLAVQEMINESNSIDADEILEAVVSAADESYEAKVALVGRESFSAFERSIMLQTLDSRWREHLAALDHLRQGIHLRGYAQKNPKQEYKREAFELFSAMLDRIKFDTVTTVSKIQVRSQEEIEREELERQQRLARALQLQHAEAVSPIQAGGFDERDGGDGGGPVGFGPGGGSLDSDPGVAGQVATPFVREMPKVGRNEACPCGSGKKFKHCHGALQQANG